MNSVPIVEGASKFTCDTCGAQSPITETLESVGAAARDPNIGKIISECEIVEKVGEGGFGSVYRALDGTLQRDVALKLLLPSLTAKPEFVSKFFREAVTAAQLNHPHIVAIHKFGKETVDGEDVHYLIMEFLEGETLSDLIEKRGELPVEEALSMILQAADALASAHDKKVIHRDIKPENLMVDSRGNVKITDFGLAKVVSTTMHTTKVVGTPHYMSPEQFEGKAVDGRTDIYSLGVTFYYMLTQAKPYKGDNTVQIIYAILTNEPRPPMEINPGVSEDLWAIIKKMIAKDVDDRYQSFREVQRDLESFGERSLRAMVKCPRCETDNPQGRRFCRDCGAPLVVTCPSCSSEEPAGSRHCGQCGSNIALSQNVKETEGRASKARSRGDLGLALRLYEEILEIQPDNADAEKATGELRAEVAKLEGVREEAANLVSRGDLEEALGKVEAALDHLPSAALKSLRTEIETKATVKAVMAHRMVGDTAISEHDYQAAVEAYRKAAALDPDDPEIQIEVRDAEKKAGDLAQNLDDARKQFDAQNFDHAFSAANKALALAPNNEIAVDIHQRAKGYLDSVDSLLAQGREDLADGQYEEAATTFASALEVRPGHEEATSLAREAADRLAAFDALLEKARAGLASGDHAQAAGILDKLDGERPFDDRLNDLRTTCRSAAKKAAAGQRALDLISAGRDAEKQGRLEDAADSYEQALAIDPTVERTSTLLGKVRQKIEDCEGLIRLADEHETEGNFAQALEACKKLIALTPGDMALTSRIQTLERKRNTLDENVEGAEAALEASELDRADTLAAKALEMSPENRLAVKVRKEVDRRRGAAERHLAEAKARLAGELFEEAASLIRKAEETGYRGPELDELRAQSESGRVSVLKSNATRSFRFSDFDGAIKAYDEILKVDSDDRDALAGRKAAVKKNRALRRESPLLKMAASVVLLLGLSGVQLMAVSKPLEVASGNGEDGVAVRPPVVVAEEVDRDPEVPWDRSTLTGEDFQRFVHQGAWGELEDLAVNEAKTFPEAAAVTETLRWVRGMKSAEELDASEKIRRLSVLEPPTDGPLKLIASAKQDEMLERLKGSLLTPDEWVREAKNGDLKALLASLRQVDELGAGGAAGGLADTIQFVEKLGNAVEKAESQDPVQAIREIGAVPEPNTGLLRAAAPEIVAARTSEAIRLALTRAREAEETDLDAASALYDGLVAVLEEVEGDRTAIEKAEAGSNFTSFMSGGADLLKRATSAEEFGAANEYFGNALRAARSDAESRTAREKAARSKLDEVESRLEDELTKVWSHDGKSFGDLKDQELVAAFELFAKYAVIMGREGREDALSEEEADKRLVKLTRERRENR
jgi:serine/threonine protein kinase